MSVSKDFEQYVIDQLSTVGEVTSRRMFGGVGIYLDGLFCAIIGADSGRVFFKVDDSNRTDFLNENMGPFRTSRGSMSYFEVPVHVLEDQDLLHEWALKARAVALNSAK